MAADRDQNAVAPSEEVVLADAGDKTDITEVAQVAQTIFRQVAISCQQTDAADSLSPSFTADI